MTEIDYKRRVVVESIIGHAARVLLEKHSPAHDSVVVVVVTR